jgi:hypothetical protein
MICHARFPACSMTTPAIRVQFLILVGEGIFKSAAMQIQRHDISSGERALGQIRQKQFVDDTRASDADPTLDCPSGMGRHDEPALLPARAQREIRTVVEGTHRPAFRMGELLVFWQVQTSLDFSSLEQLLVFTARDIRQSC